MLSERITFPSYRGDTLSARLDRPHSAPIGYALFAHCFSCSKDVLSAVHISRALAERGIACLRFDFTGLGDSEGEFANTNFSSNIQDLLQAAQFLSEHFEAPKLLIGHSLGGGAVLAAAGSLPETLAVATLNAPSDPQPISQLFAEVLPAIHARGEVEVTLAGRPFKIQRQFLEDISRQNLLAYVAHLRKPLLIFHSPADTVVAVEHATRLYEAAQHPKSLIALDGADHLLSRSSDALFVADILTAWAMRYIQQAPATVSEEPRTVRVSATGASPFAQHIQIGPHQLTADEPVSAGGQDLGPSPYDYLLAGLGACTAMTLRLYARHKKLPLEQIAVTLSYAKIHAADCETCETTEGKIDKIERILDLGGQLDAEQKARLIEIAEKCPVHRTLRSEILIQSRLAEE